LNPTTFLKDTDLKLNLTTTLRHLGIILLGLLLFNSTSGADPELATAPFTLQSGDLLFQDLDCGPICNAIESVTHGFQGAQLSHMGIVNRDSAGTLTVIEAISAGVVATAADSFLSRSHDQNGQPKVLVGRLKEPYQLLIPNALRCLDSLLGKPYDNIFIIGDQRYYCSEMVYEIFKRANRNQPLFELTSMTFKDPATGVTLPLWETYYRKLEVPIPEGEPGINPGSISRSDKISIIYIYGKPDGFTQESAKPLESP
jgi:hypothetical protein